LSDADALRPLVPYFSGQKLRSAGVVLLIVVQTVAILPIAWLIQHVFDTTLAAGDRTGLVLALGAVLALFSVNALATIATRHVALGIIKPGIRKMRSDAARNLVAREPAFFATADIDELQTAMVRSSERVDWLVTALFTQIFPALVVSAGLSAVLLALNPLLFLATALAMAAGYVVTRLFRTHMRRHVDLFHSDYDRYGKVVAFLFRFSELIRVQAAEPAALDRVHGAAEAMRRSGHRLSWLGTVHTVLQNYVLSIGLVLVLLIGGLQVLGGQITIGGLLSFYVCLNILTAQTRIVTGTLPIISEGIACAEALAPYLVAPPSAAAGQSFEGLRDALELSGATVAMGGATVIRGGTLRLGRGEIVGLFGASGSGKTTLIGALLGLHPLGGGELTVDGRPIERFDVASYRRRVGVLSQSMLLFPGTIRENLTFGLDEATAGALDEACRQAHVLELVASLPEGYDTVIGDRGMRLSGGQAQRIALARAFLRAPDILLLDEPDNHLDDATFQAILGGIRARGTTTLLVSHNRGLVGLLDRVYEVDRGIVMQSEGAVAAADAYPLVSVVMPAFNAERYIAEAIASVLGQTYPRIELVVVDDGSTDRTREIMRAFGDRLVAIDSPANGGIGDARNRGLAAAKGDFIAFMDADDIWTADKIERQMRAFEEEPGLGLSFTQMQCFVSPELPDEVRELRACPTEPQAGIVAATALVRRAVVERVGPFDTALKVGEFIDWFSRAKDEGFTWRLEPGVHLKRRIHDSNTGVTQRASYVDYVRVARRALKRREAAGADDAG
jgi:ABC-type multidrug transport system fused ATPase/permease subunit/GT2 family glycosyltransferase